jgi:hypothetical protein
MQPDIRPWRPQKGVVPRILTVSLEPLVKTNMTPALLWDVTVPKDLIGASTSSPALPRPRPARAKKVAAPAPGGDRKRDGSDIDKRGVFRRWHVDAANSPDRPWRDRFPRLESRRGANAVVRETDGPESAYRPRTPAKGQPRSRFGIASSGQRRATEITNIGPVSLSRLLSISRETQLSLDRDELLGLMQDSLESLALKLGMLVASSLLEDEVTRLCGPRHGRQPHKA